MPLRDVVIVLPPESLRLQPPSPDSRCAFQRILTAELITNRRPLSLP
jgi:hypothetical protein